MQREIILAFLSKVGAVILAVVVLSCGAETRDLELVSSALGVERRVEVLLERPRPLAKGHLIVQLVEGSRRIEFGPLEIERMAGVVGASREVFEADICLAEIAWASRNEAVVLVKNCLGHVTMFAVACEKKTLVSAEGFHHVLRRALYNRYRRNPGVTEENALEWIRGDSANIAYQSKKVGNGRLMD